MAETAPKCERLASYIQEFDLKIAKDIAPDCQKLNVEDEKAFSKEIFSEYKCEGFSAIEAKIQELESRLDFLNGFEKLKADLKAQKEKVDDKSLKTAQVAGLNFKDGLITAQSLELLLNAEDEDGDSLFLKLRKVPLEKRKDQKLFQTMLSDFCKKDFKDQAACNKDFWAPSDKTIEEINALLDKKETNEKEIESWRSALAIKKKDNSAYSFTEMRQQLSKNLPESSEKALTRTQLKAIKDLPDFKNAKGLEFLNLEASKKELLKDSAKYQFNFLVEDLKKRQEFEAQSKLSLLLGEFKSNLTSSEVNSCQDAKINFSKVGQCLKSLETVESRLSGTPQAHLKKMREVLNISLNYHDSLDELTGLCIQSAEEDLINCEKKLNADQAKIQLQIQSLNLLKEKIGIKNQDLMKLRNFAIEKFQKMDCAKSEQSIIDECDGGFILRTSKEVNLLTADAMDISIVYSKKTTETDISEICNNPEKKVIRKIPLCAFLTDTTPDVIETKNNEVKEPADYIAPTDTPDGGHSASKDAMVYGISNIFGQVANQYMMGNYYSPTTSYYPMYNFTPYSVSGFGMSPSDQILFNARYYGGLGFYMPVLPNRPLSTPSTITGFGTSSNFFNGR